jgi:hypothetical protein
MFIVIVNLCMCMYVIFDYVCDFRIGIAADTYC